MKPDIDYPAQAEPPRGYRWGAFVSGPGWSGYYLVRKSDGAHLVANLRPDLSVVARHRRFPDADELTRGELKLLVDDAFAKTHGNMGFGLRKNGTHTYTVVIENQPDGWDVSANSLKEAVNIAVQQIRANETHPVGTLFNIRRSNQTRYDGDTYEVTKTGIRSVKPA
jgi:hypothetical protein